MVNGVKIEKKKSEIVKGKGGKLWKWKVEKLWNEERTFFFFFFFACHFSKPLKFVLGSTKMEIFLLRPWLQTPVCEAFSYGYGIFHCDSMKYDLVLHWITMKYAVSRMKMPHVKDLRGNPKPWVSPDRTGPKPVRGRGTFLRIFSGRVGSGNFISGQSGSGNFISGRSGSGYFLPGCETFSPRHFRDKLAFYSQTEEVEWLLSLISTLFDDITSLQGIFTRCL